MIKIQYFHDAFSLYFYFDSILLEFLLSCGSQLLFLSSCLAVKNSEPVFVVVCFKKKKNHQNLVFL
jgi:hypothetical protein